MIFFPRPSALLRAAGSFALLATAFVFLLLAGCGNTSNEVTDPQLKPIQEMLNTQLPVGSSEGTVQQFLSARGYPIERSDKPGTLVGIIRHIDTENGNLQPVTARVTFYFDANGKLNTTEIARTFNRRPPLEATSSTNSAAPTNGTDSTNTTSPPNSSNPTNP